MSKKRLLSGAQPTGELTIGNYCGAVKQFIKYQQDYDSFFFIPDLHSITVPQQNKTLIRERLYKMINIYLASGLDGEKSTFFIQSEVPAHNQLAWILECHSYMGELSRMTQFKEKSIKQQNVGCGLFTYPVLMASDILLYDTHVVPVGEDQKQHVELARDLALRFNHQYGPTFVCPEPLIPTIGARIKDLQYPEKKMSKSAEDKNGSIFILDDEKTIRQKIARAVTDSDGIVKYDVENKPGISNLINIYSAMTNTPLEKAIDKFTGMTRYGDFKREVTDAVLDTLLPLQAEYNRLIKTDYADQVLNRGRDRANEIAEAKYDQVRKLVGLGR